MKSLSFQEAHKALRDSQAAARRILGFLLPKVKSQNVRVRGLYLEPARENGCGALAEPARIGCGLYLEPARDQCRLSIDAERRPLSDMDVESARE